MYAFSLGVGGWMQPHEFQAWIFLQSYTFRNLKGRRSKVESKDCSSFSHSGKSGDDLVIFS